MKQCFRTGVRFSSSPPEEKRQSRQNKEEDACGIRTADVLFSYLYIGFSDRRAGESPYVHTWVVFYFFFFSNRAKKSEISIGRWK